MKYEEFIEWVIKEYAFTAEEAMDVGNPNLEGTICASDLRTALAEWLKLKGEDA